MGTPGKREDLGNRPSGPALSLQKGRLRTTGELDQLALSLATCGTDPSWEAQGASDSLNWPSHSHIDSSAFPQPSQPLPSLIRALCPGPLLGLMQPLSGLQDLVHLRPGLQPLTLPVTQRLSVCRTMGN